MSLVNKYPFLESSVQPGKVALRIRGFLVSLIPAIVFIANLKGWDIGEEGVRLIIDKIFEVASAAGTVIGAMMFLWGWIRKFI